MKELRASMDTIRKTSAEIIGQIETQMKELQVELPEQKEELSAMQFAEQTINRLEQERTIFSNDQRNLIVNFAFKLDDRDATEQLAGNLADAVLSGNREKVFELSEEAQTRLDSLPDPMIGLSELHEAGFYSDIMLPLTGERAVELYREGVTVYGLNGAREEQGQSQKLINLEQDISQHDGLFGVTKFDWENYQRSMETAITPEEKMKIKETILLEGEGNRYGIYQINSRQEERGYQFLGLEAAKELGFTIHGKDYQMVYSERLRAATTLDNLYERFNIERPNDFTGHSMSVSDVIVMNHGGNLKAYYVDSFGFEELPDFIAQRAEVLDASSIKAYPEVYMGTLEKAMQERNVDTYLDSRKLNIDCKNAIEQAISDNFDGMSLNPDTAVAVVEKYGEERVAFVLANTLKQLSYDGRFSDLNKQWAEGIEVPENISRGMDLNRDYVVSSHPAVLNGFIDMARREIRTHKLEQVLDVKNQHITENTKGYEADGHTGTWYALDMKEYHGERFFQMRSEQYGQEVADIIVSENGILVAEDIWHGFDEGAREAISEYLEENGATVYDMTEIPAQATIILADETVLKTEKQQAVNTESWEQTLTGKNLNEEEQQFSFFEIHKVRENNGIDLKMPDIHYVDQYYVIEDLEAKGDLKIERYNGLEAALGAYYSLPNHKMKALGIENTAPLPGSLDFIQCKNGIDTLIYDCQKVEGWLNPEIYNIFKNLKISLDGHDTEIAYKIGESYLTIQTTEEGYDYTFFDENYLEQDGGIYDDPDISISDAVDEILQEEGFSIKDAEVTDYEALEMKTEHAEKENIEQVQMEQNCPKSIFEGYDRNTAIETYEGITVQFAEAKTYLTVQPTKEGYSYIFYDTDLKDVGGGTHEYLDDSIQEATYAILKKEGMQKEQCIKIDDLTFRDELIQNAKELLENGTVRRTSELGRCEAALNGMNRAEIEYDVLAHTRAILEEMGMENEVTLIGARVYGSRSREGLYYADSDVDVVVAYRGNIREDVLFNAVNEAGLKIAGLPIDINPISEERTGTLAEYMKQAEEYLDKKAHEAVIEEQPKGTIEFYVAECMEFPVMGEYHENLTLEEALRIYETIPADRMNGIKGVGFELHDGSDYDGPYDLMRMGTVDREGINMIQHYKDSPLVQKAMDDVEKYFAEKPQFFVIIFHGSAQVVALVADGCRV